jgi:hypothetical protein
MSRWIEKRAGFVTKDAMREDKAVAHFAGQGNDEQVYKVSLDAATEQSIPLQDVEIITSAATRTLKPRESGKTFVIYRGAGVNFTLPKANKGKLVYHFVIPILNSAVNIWTTQSTDEFTYDRGLGVAGAAVTFGPPFADLPCERVTIMSDGGIAWYADASTTRLQTTEVTISAADIVSTSAGKFGHADGQIIVAAPGAGKALLLESAVLIFDYGTHAYGGGGNTTFNYGAGGKGALTGLVAAGDSIGAGADKTVYFHPLSTAGAVLEVNASINLKTASAYTVDTGSNGVARVRVNYRVITTGL